MVVRDILTVYRDGDVAVDHALYEGEPGGNVLVAVSFVSGPQVALVSSHASVSESMSPIPSIRAGREYESR